MKTATEIGLILNCSPWKVGLIAHSQKWVLRQIKSPKDHGKMIKKYMVSDEELKSYKIDNAPMPPYRMTDADVNSISQKSWYIHFGIIDVPQPPDLMNSLEFKVKTHITWNDASHERNLKHTFRLKSNDKIKMMDVIKHLIIYKGVTKTVDIWKLMNVSGDIPEIKTGKPMALNTFYMYVRQARIEVYNG